jgi:ABC-type multidrug transport system fused ATPase/permease subunit
MNLQTFLALFLSHRRASARLFALLVVYILVCFVEPLFYLVFVDEVVLKTNLDLLVVLVATLGGWAILHVYLRGLTKYWRYLVGQRVIADLRRNVFGKLLAQPPGEMRQRGPGQMVALSSVELDAVDAIHDALFWGVATAFAVVVILTVAFVIDPGLAWLLLVPVAVVALVLGLLDGRARKRSALALAVQARLIAFLKLRYSNVPTVQAFGREPSETARLADVADDLAASRARTEQLMQIMQRLLDLSRHALMAGLLLVGGKRIIHDGDLTLGALTALLNYADRLVTQVRDTFQYIVNGRVALPALTRVREVLETPPPPRPTETVELTRPRGEIRFENVSFRHTPDGPWVLSNVSFTVRAGEKVGLVGVSGSGKSTIFQLLLGFLQPTSGRILLDGRDLRGVSVESLRRHLGLATQEPVLFDLSVADNVRYGCPDASDAEVEAALEQAKVGDLLATLPRGIHTLVGEGFADLSGGERQRLALARVMLKDPAIVLLDEVTAALDARTEEAVVAAMARFAEGRTTLAIAHRLSTVTGCHRILVMEAGKVVAVGSHNELAAQPGLYRDLWRAAQTPAAPPRMCMVRGTPAVRRLPINVVGEPTQDRAL